MIICMLVRYTRVQVRNGSTGRCGVSQHEKEIHMRFELPNILFESCKAML